MELTQEQMDIINSTGNIKINVMQLLLNKTNSMLE